MKVQYVVESPDQLHSGIPYLKQIKIQVLLVIYKFLKLFIKNE